MRFAVLANTRARWFRDDAKNLEALYRVTSGRGLALTPSTPEEMEQELAALLDDRPEFLAVAGGDGTLSHFTTALLRVWPHDELPPVLVLHAGTMNTISRSMGSVGDPVAQLESVCKAPDGSLAVTRRWPLQVGERRWGYLFGTGIVPRYIQAYDQSSRGPKEAARTLAKLVSAALLGGNDPFFARHRCDVVVDGRTLPLKEWLLVTAGAVDDMGLRFRPFHGLLDTPGRMGVFATASKPHRFAMDLLPFRFARPVRHALAFQLLADRLELRAPEPLVYNLDGEVEVAPSSLTVSVGPPVTFLLPPGSRPPRNRLGP